MCDEAEKEAVVPCCAFDFLPHGYFLRVSAQDVEGEFSQDSEVLGRIVISGSVGIFLEDDVEHPVQLVLDGPVASHGAKQGLCPKVFREQVVADVRWLCLGSPQGSPGCDPRDGLDTREFVIVCEGCVADDCCTARFSPAMSGRFDPSGVAARSSMSKAALDGGEQFALVFLSART